MGWIEGLIHLPFGSGAVSQSSSLPTKLWGGQVTLPAGAFNGEGGNNMIARAYPAGLVNQNNSACNCKSGYTGMPAQLNSGVSNMTVNYPQGTYYSGECACIPTSSMSQLVNPSNSNSNIPAHIQTNSSNSGSNNTMSMQTFYGGNNMNLGNECDCFYNSTTNQYQSFCGMSLVPPGFKYYGQHCPSDTINTTVSASSSSPVAPIQNLMNNWFAWGKQPTNTAGNEPTNTKAALNTMTNQWQFFPSQNAGNSVSANTASTNITSTANPTSQAQTALSSATSTASANASPQASNGLSEAAQEFEKAINSIFGSISNFVKNL